jgi:hypothetical protein
MIVPSHWAEARKVHRMAGRQLTVRRFGWSDLSEVDALAMAERRADEAVQRILAGESLERRERKLAYNGAVGVPIREEVLARHGPEVITRNAYGAHCLNTPRALFADIDHSPRALSISAWLLGAIRRVVTAGQDPEQVARRRIDAFLNHHPDWSLRVYRTPAGLRVMVTHRPFDAASPEVAQFFSAIGADPLYVRMCLHQRCFRARLTAKPWRIGIADHMRPRPGVWPVGPERLPQRQQWVAAYERAAAGYAACRFVAALGSGVVHPDMAEVIALHDGLARANEPALTIA